MPTTSDWNKSDILNCDDIVMFNNWDDIGNENTYVLPMKRRKMDY